MFSYKQQLLTGACIVQALMCLLTITLAITDKMHNVNKMDNVNISHSRHINNYVDYASLTLHDIASKFINVYPTSLSTPICKLLTFL